MATVHRSPFLTFHPNPRERELWTIRDARDFAVVGPPCDRCGACECSPCECHGEPIHERGCEGLSYAFIRLPDFFALCESCAAAEGIRVVACDCEPAAVLP
jgi:hypothetical protein